MLIPKTIRKGSEGAEVWDCQFRLNFIAKAMGRLTVFNELKVDGIFGKNTKTRVEEFQGNFSLVSDGIVGRATWGHIMQMTEGAKPPKHVARPARQKSPTDSGNSQEKAGASLVEAHADKLRASDPATADFVDDLIADHFVAIKGVLGVIGTAEAAANFVGMVRYLRTTFSPKEIAIIFEDIARLSLKGNVARSATSPHRFINNVLKLAGNMGASGSRLASALGKFGKVAFVAAILIAAIEAGNFMRKGEYSAAAGEVYKCFISIAVPWGALIDGIQAVAEALFPDLMGQKAKGGFALLKTLNPVALGGTGVDAAITIQAEFYRLMLTGKISWNEFEKVVSRMRSGPAKFFVEAGEWWGDKAADAGGDWFYENVLKHTDFFD